MNEKNDKNREERRPPAQDPLEAFVRANRESFDEAAPRGGWERLEAALDAERAGTPALSEQAPGARRGRVVSLQPWARTALRAAASVVVLLGAMALLLPYFGNRNAGGQDDPSYSAVFTELHDMENHYGELVGKKAEQIRSSDRLTPEEAENVLAFLDELESEYERLRAELATEPDAERIVQAMIENYRQRIEVLERIYDIVNEKETSNDDRYANTITL